MSCRKLLTLVGAVLVLQACGGAREEPFDPADPEPEQPDPVEITLWAEGNTVRVEPDSEYKQILVARDADEYFRLLDIYVLAQEELPGTPNFEEGQVVFFDAGVVDNRNCARKLILREYDGEATADNLVTLVLKHQNFVPSNSTCTGSPQHIRPYSIFYVPERGDLMVREELR